MKAVRRWISLLVTLVMVGSMSVSAFAANPDVENEVDSLFSGPDITKETLNELSRSPASEVYSVMMRDGTPMQIETRELEVSENLTIVNTRTYTSSYNNAGIQVFSIEDSYGLFYAGIQGFGGYLEASYTYFHPVIDNQNQMQTQFLSAAGDVQDLLDGVYKYTGSSSSFDAIADYNVSANVEINISANANSLFPDLIAIWMPATYTNTCDIDKYGVAHFSWS